MKLPSILDFTPAGYELREGHVLHFYNKLGFIADRYEMRRRGYVCNQIPRSELLKDIDSRLVRSYNPTVEAVELNRERIQLRMPK